MKNFIQKARKKAAVKMIAGLNKLLKDENGGVSPLVVTIGLALILAVLLVALSPTIKTAITDSISTVFSRLQSL